MNRPTLLALLGAGALALLAAWFARWEVIVLDGGNGEYAVLDRATGALKNCKWEICVPVVQASHWIEPPPGRGFRPSSPETK